MDIDRAMSQLDDIDAALRAKDQEILRLRAEIDGIKERFQSHDCASAINEVRAERDLLKEAVELYRSSAIFHQCGPDRECKCPACAADMLLGYPPRLLRGEER